MWVLQLTTVGSILLLVHSSTYVATVTQTDSFDNDLTHEVELTFTLTPDDLRDLSWVVTSRLTGESPTSRTLANPGWLSDLEYCSEYEITATARSGGVDVATSEAFYLRKGPITELGVSPDGSWHDGLSVAVTNLNSQPVHGVLASIKPTGGRYGNQQDIAVTSLSETYRVTFGDLEPSTDYVMKLTPYCVFGTAPFPGTFVEFSAATDAAPTSTSAVITASTTANTPALSHSSTSFKSTFAPSTADDADQSLDTTTAVANHTTPETGARLCAESTIPLWAAVVSLTQAAAILGLVIATTVVLLLPPPGGKAGAGE